MEPAGRALSRLEGMRAIVTGATRPIGRAIVERLCAEGASVLATGRDQARAAYIPEVAERSRTGCWFIPLDLTSDADRQQLVAQAAERMDGLDIVVNNAGASRQAIRGGVESVEPSSVHDSVTMNAVVPLMLVQYGLPFLLSSECAAIVNVSSRAAILGTPGHLAYTAGKGALEAITRALSAELAARGIRCNSVAPGAVTRGPRATSGHDPDISPQLTADTTPRDVAAAVAFLASRDAVTISGVTLPVDGASSTTRARAFG